MLLKLCVYFPAIIFNESLMLLMKLNERIISSLELQHKKRDETKCIKIN